MSRPRVLMCGAPLHDVYRDLAAGLERLGWQVDVRAFSVADADRAEKRSVGRGLLSAAPGWLGKVARRAATDLGGADAASRWFETIETTIARGEYDVVVVYLDQAPVGLARLAVRCHARPVLISLVAITYELSYRWGLPALRQAARFRLGRALHPDLFRAVNPNHVPVVVIPSDAWRDAAVAAGVPAGRARVIPFGVAIPGEAIDAARPLVAPARLLWAGRLAPEKGLHLFLDALPTVVEKRAVVLTAITAPGPPLYEEQIARTIRGHRLEQVVRLRPAVPRAELAEAYAHHDLLLFHSVFEEPVAQVMLQAGAAGLPIVGPASRRAGSLLRDGETACCYDEPSPNRVADAILRALDDAEARAVRARRLRAEVRATHDAARTIAEYHALLCARCGLTSQLTSA